MLGGELWQPVALVLIGAVGTGALMMIRGDFLGRGAAAEVDKRLSIEIDDAEERLNSRIDREMGAIGRDVRDIKASIVRIEERIQ